MRYIDRCGSRILVFDKDGTFLFKLGPEGTGDGQFTDPEYLDVDSDGNVFVSDRKQKNIEVFNPVI